MKNLKGVFMLLVLFALSVCVGCSSNAPPNGKATNAYKYLTQDLSVDVQYAFSKIDITEKENSNSGLENSMFFVNNAMESAANVTYTNLKFQNEVTATTDYQYASNSENVYPTKKVRYYLMC